MGKGIANKIGQFRYADGALSEKAFSGRLFKILIAGAEEAGVIGSECNGIAILDDNFQRVALTGHVREASGYYGPSERQWAEFRRILAMDWREFTSFLRQHPNYRRGSVPDVDDPEPMKIEPETDRIIYPSSAKDQNGPYSFPLESRREIIQFLTERIVYESQEPHRRYAIAWNIKAPSPDTSGRTAVHSPNPEFDERWKEYLESNEDLFWELAADALRPFTDGLFSTYPGDDQGDYSFEIAGRQGGWLLLTGIKGLGPMLWFDQVQMREWFKRLSDQDLIKVYRAVATLDTDVNPEKEMKERYAEHRRMKEQEWAAALKPGPGA